MNMNLRTAPTQEALADGAADFAIIKSAEAIVAVKEPVGARLMARLGSLLERLVEPASGRAAVCV